MSEEQDSRMAKSAQKMKRLKGRVTDVETTVSSWEQRLMEIDQQHQSMFSQYSKKICKLTSEMEALRTKLKTSNKRVKELEDCVFKADANVRGSTSSSVVGAESLVQMETQTDTEMTVTVAVSSTMETGNHTPNDINVERASPSADSASITDPTKLLGMSLDTTTYVPDTTSGSNASSDHVSGGSETRENPDIHLRVEEFDGDSEDRNEDTNYDSQHIDVQHNSLSESLEDSLDCKPFTCLNCFKIFLTQTALKEHYQSVHQQLECLKCSKRFGMLSALDAHMSKQHQDDENSRGNIVKSAKRVKWTNTPDLFPCGECGIGYKYLSSLQRHRKQRHPAHYEVVQLASKGISKSGFECQFCQKRHLRKDTLEHHIARDHQGDKPFQCPHCPDRTFCFKSSMTKHIRNVHSELSVTTPGKKASLRERRMGNSHSVNITKSKNNEFPCLKCSRCFETKKQLEGHYIRIHSARKRQKLRYRKKSLRSKYKWWTDKSISKCVPCQNQYDSHWNLRRHVRSRHPDLARDYAPRKVSKA